MNYTYQFFNHASSKTYVQEFLNGKKVEGGFLSLNLILENIEPHRDYKALKNRIKRWILYNHPELFL